MPTYETTSRRLVLVPSALGWMALIGEAEALKQLTFGHSSPEAAAAALDSRLIEGAVEGAWNEDLLGRLVAYAAGEPVDFDDVPVDPGPLSPFRQQVFRHCRQIPYGQTRTYGQLASAADLGHAARAVGSCMAANRIPLIIPCHRVVSASGRIGGFSAPGGRSTKQRLLALEAAGGG